jgi:hypothetical protein
MVTKTAGGLTTPDVGITVEAEYAAQKGDPVMITGDYAVNKCDGSAPCIGYVGQRNVRRGTLAGGNAGQYPVANTPGIAEVNAFGVGVKDFVVGAVAVVAGTGVGINAAGLLAPDGAGVSHIGVVLMGGATGASVDVLLGCV